MCVCVCACVGVCACVHVWVCACVCVCVCAMQYTNTRTQSCIPHLTPICTGVNKETFLGGLGNFAHTFLISPGNLKHLEPPSKANNLAPPEPVVLEDRVKLDFPAIYLGLLMGRSGVHIKALCQQHKVAVHFTGEDGEEGEGKGKRPESRVAGPVVWVVVKHELGSGVEEFKEHLKQKAGKVVEKRKKHEISVSGECVGDCVCYVGSLCDV